MILDILEKNTFCSNSIRFSLLLEGALAQCAGPALIPNESMKLNMTIYIYIFISVTMFTDLDFFSHMKHQFVCDDFHDVPPFGLSIIFFCNYFCPSCIGMRHPCESLFDFPNQHIEILSPASLQIMYKNVHSHIKKKLYFLH